jgi:hypothetical protein
MALETRSSKLAEGQQYGGTSVYRAILKTTAIAHLVSRWDENRG